MQLQRRVAYGVLALVAAGLGVALIPFSVVLAPEVTLTVVDSAGHLLPGICVYEAWEFYAVEDEEHTYELRSDSNGQVYLPERRLSVSGMEIVRGSIANFRENPVHSSYGISSYAVLRGPGLVGEAGYFGKALDDPPRRVVMRPEDQPDALKRRLAVRCEP